MQCSLTKEELEALMPLYDTNNNGKVDGFEFILTFYHLRFEYRGLKLTTRIESNNRVKSATIKRKEDIDVFYGQKNFLILPEEVCFYECAGNYLHFFLS